MYYQACSNRLNPGAVQSLEGKSIPYNFSRWHFPSSEASAGTGTAFSKHEHRVRQKRPLPECGGQGNNVGVIIYSFSLHISPAVS